MDFRCSLGVKQYFTNSIRESFNFKPLNMVFPLIVDGSYGEGGGQILRSTLALSIITGKPAQIVNIRAGRKKPGLRPQHLTSVKAAAAISHALVKGAEIGAPTLEFVPNPVQAGTFHFDVGTAGAVMLILQTLWPPLCEASGKSQLSLRGGTHVPWSPPFHYFKEVFLPMVTRMGMQAEVNLLKAGWYPQGGGEVTATISPVGNLGWKPLNLSERGALRRITIYSLLSNLPESIAQRACDQAVSSLSKIEVIPRREIHTLPSIGQGMMVVLVAEFEHTVVGFDVMGQVGKRAEQVAEEAVQLFLEFYSSEATVDTHLADQLLLYMALAKGNSCIITNHLTEHTRTNLWLIEKFLPIKFHVAGELGKKATITTG
jgi:RNA 3'-terminal phosphate cyclase (ATP)